MKKEYIQPKAKEIKVELQPIMEPSITIGDSSTNDNDITEGNDAKEDQNGPFGW